MMTPQAREHFSRQGHCLVEGVPEARDFEPVIAASEKVLANRCRQMHARGQPQGDYADAAGCAGKPGRPCAAVAQLESPAYRRRGLRLIIRGGRTGPEPGQRPPSNSHGG